MTESATATDRIGPLVNGQRRPLPPGTTVGGLLRALGLDPRLVVVEINRAIVRDRAALEARVLSTGDEVEIVHFVGGG
ncbi:MAG TPA: sulfur carrier protein ThiS [Gemmatimonadaceae bacterium]|nr:sulfur carrier protein ThiS [Gemmatimonadaceae bacterium]